MEGVDVARRGQFIPDVMPDKMDLSSKNEMTPTKEMPRRLGKQIRLRPAGLEAFGKSERLQAEYNSNLIGRVH